MPVREMQKSDVIVVGGGVAGVSTVRALTSNAAMKGRSVTVLTDEPMLYYYRPKLPDYLAGRISRADLVAYAASWYAERGVDYRVSVRVTAIDASAMRVYLADGTSLSCPADGPQSALVLATGGKAFLPPIDGSGLRGVFTLRTVADADAILAYIDETRAANVAVVGGGLLGLECAAALAAKGLAVTVLEVADRLLPRQLDAAGAAMLESHMSSLRVKVMTGVKVTRIAGTGAGVPGGVRVAALELVDGEGSPKECPSDVVLVSAGTAPDTELAKAAGLKVARGVVVNDWMETSVPRVYAVGDVAEHSGRTYGIVQSAVDQAKTAAGRILGEGEPYKGTTPQTTLKVAGLDVTSIGDVSGSQGTSSLESVAHAPLAYLKLFVKDGVPVGAIAVGTKANVPAIARAVNAGHEMTQQELERLIAAT